MEIEEAVAAHPVGEELEEKRAVAAHAFAEKADRHEIAQAAAAPTFQLWPTGRKHMHTLQRF